ncbi:MAG: hypothetical protein VB055_11455 [Oscillospiraceae bacterium]|nr:hypothetical protein [Oscillospiraceae bacterium]
MHSMTAPQRRFLLLGAAGAPLAVFCGGGSLLWAVPALALISLLDMYLERCIPAEQSLAALLPRWLLWPELAFLILAATRMAGAVDLVWAGSADFPLFPLALLVLAGAQATIGTASAGRCATVLGWAEAIFFAAILGVTAAQTAPPAQAGEPVEALSVIFCLLTVCCGLFLPAEKDQKGGVLWGALALLTMLILYVTAGKGGELPILTAVKSADILGVLQRFESLCSCAITAGLFLLLSVFACASGEILRALGLEKCPPALPLLPAAILLAVEKAVPDWVYLAGAAIFWGGVPLVALGLVGRTARQKRGGKTRKKC